MKKLLAALMSVVICLSFIGGTSCSKKEGADKELRVGDTIKIYPTNEFDYFVDGKGIVEDFTVHISSISMVVSDVHTPNASQPLSGLYYPYTYKIVIKGQTSPELCNYNLQIWISYNTGSRFDIRTTVSENGNFSCEYLLDRGNLTGLYFSSISLIAT